MNMNAEHTVAKTNELEDGQMKEVQAGDRNVLLLRWDGQFRAYLPECPHHGAPLAKGHLSDGRLVCPWHQTVFDALNGHLIEPPSLNHLPTFDVRVDGDDVIVVVPPAPDETSGQPSMARYDAQADPRTFAILGTGAAGLAAAETLREEGFAGRLVVLTGEQDLPYDRTECSKRFLADADKPDPILRSEELFRDHDIEILTGHRVTRADLAGKTLETADGTAVPYDKLLIASGSRPRRLGVDGGDLGGIYTLRSLADARCLREAAQDADRAVVVGASFIGMEVAAALAQHDVQVTIVAPESVPFEGTLGPQLGRAFQHVHENEGTAFRLGTKIDRFEGAGEKVRAAVLDGGDRIEADLVVVGVGVAPVTDFLDELKLNDDGSIPVNRRLQAAESVFAAGDIASFPDWRDGVPIRIEHWRLAQQHGRLAARNMLGQDMPYAGVPFFWTQQHGVIAQFVGHVSQPDEIVLDGDPDEQDAMAFYVKGGKVRAVAGIFRDWQMAVVAELFAAERLFTLEEVRSELDQAHQPQPA